MVYYLRFVRGLKTVVQSELFAKIDQAEVLASTTEKLRFRYDGELGKLLTLRSVEDIYIEIFRFNLNPFKSPFNFISRQVARSDIEKALFIHRQVNDKPSKRTSFRFDVSITGEYPFQRKELRNAFQEVIFNRFSRWRLETENPMLEFWVDLYQDELCFALRLTNKNFKGRFWKVAHLEASLKPTIAYALLWMSCSQKGDILLDPMCGAGTILIEGALNFPFSRVLGGDIDNRAIQAAQRNTKRASARVQLMNWDISQLPLDTASVDRIVTNPPWGKQVVGDKFLYQRLLAECIRTLRPNGSVVMLTPYEEINKINKYHGKLEFMNPSLPIEVLGQRVQVCRFKRI